MFSTRTLQDWRNNGTISYIQINGKILYRQSDNNNSLQKTLHLGSSKKTNKN